MHRNLLGAGYPGRIFGVNPKYSEVFGTACYPTLSALPEVPECVVLAVPAEATIELTRECAQLGVRGIIALASGFAEAGERGAERQRRLAAIARDAGIALLGPNGIGGWNVAARFAAFSPPLPGDPKPGGVAMVSQSGGLLLEIANPLIERGVGLSHLLSTGNEAGTTLEEFVAYLLEQPAVRTVVAIVESFHAPREVRGVLARARELGKPIVVLKVGRSAAGSRAAASHTGALAQDDRVVSTMLDEGGAIRVRGTEDLIETLVLLERVPRVERGETVLVSTSGGRCSLLGDLASAAGLPLARLAEPTLERLRTILPEFGTPNNPLDPTGVVFDREGVYAPVLTAIASDPGVGLVGVFQVTRNVGSGRTHRSVGLAGEVVEAARASATPIVAFTSTTGGVVDPQVVRVLDEGGVPLLLGLESAMAALAAVGRRAGLGQGAGSRRRGADVDDGAVRQLVQRREFDEHGAKELLAAYGLARTPGAVAGTVDEALRIAEDLGYPLVVKACGAGVAHKTERGLVRLGLRGRRELEAAVQALRGVTGTVLVERMIGDGVELILGARATEFGPMVMVGAGGVLAELVDDVQLAMAPLDEARAMELIEATRAARLLDGWRGGEVLDGAAAARCLVRLSQLICDLEDCIEEIDVNPLIITRDGAWVADALVRGRSTT